MSKEFLESAHTYLSEAFPNPDHAGCPPDSALRSLAFNPRESDPTITEHIGTCSPCFRRYSELLAELKAQPELEALPQLARLPAAGQKKDENDVAFLAVPLEVEEDIFGAAERSKSGSDFSQSRDERAGSRGRPRLRA